MQPLRAVLVLVMAAALAACAPRGPILDTGSKPEDVGGTIAGTVREAGSKQPLSGRRVTVTDVNTGARFETSTAASGGYTIKVPRGTYRLAVDLREGETLAEQPDDTQVNTSDLDPDRNFVITVRPPRR